jgi:hypothetical protein
VPAGDVPERDQPLELIHLHLASAAGSSTAGASHHPSEVKRPVGREFMRAHLYLPLSNITIG